MLPNDFPFSTLVREEISTRSTLAWIGTTKKSKIKKSVLLAHPGSTCEA